MNWLNNVVSRSKTIVLLTTILSILAAINIPKLKFDADLSNLIPSNDPVIKELEAATDEFGSQSLILIAIRTDNIYQAETLKKIEQLADNIVVIDGVAEVISPFNAEVVDSSEWGMEIVPLSDYLPQSNAEINAYRERINSSPYKDILISPDEKAAVIMIKPDASLEPGKESHLAAQLSELVNNYNSPEEIYVVGDVYSAYYAENAMKKDVLLLTPLVFLVLVAVLYLGFRSIQGVLLPMITVVLSSVWAVALMALLGVKMSIITVLVPVILLAIGSAQGIHILNRYYSYLNQGHEKNDAIFKAMQDLTYPILMTSLTTAAGFISLLSSPIPPIKHFGLFTAFGVIIAMILSLWLIPAVLVLLPAKKTLPLYAKESDVNKRDVGQIIGQIGFWIANHSTLTIIFYVLITILGITLSFNLKTESNMLRYFEKNSPVIRGTDIVENQFGGTLQLTIVVDTKESNGVKDPKLLKKLEDIEKYLITVPNVSHAKSLATIVKEINHAFTGKHQLPESQEAVAQELLLYSLQGGSNLEYFTNYDFSKTVVTARVLNAGSEEIKTVINTIDNYLSHEFGKDQSIAVSLTGMPKVIYRVMDQFARSQILSLATSSVLVAIIVALIMKSVLYGLLSILPLVITIAINFGFMGAGNIPLDAVTSMIAGIAIGIGVDYSIHYITTYLKEAKTEKNSQNIALRSGLKSGNGIFLNALTLFLGFMVLLVSNFRAIKLFGFLTALTMLISSFSALTLLPSILSWHTRKNNKEE